ncbi:MAG TPA: isoaspartyl peptidase/L-asparaginase [Acidimicrobiales bacterium]|nr:isoaspartyl peptidase/L-asparaginase [Acidimicrobiales bacterium]
MGPTLTGAGGSGWVLAAHGGAGDGIARLSPERRRAADRGLRAALRGGADLLARERSAVDAVVAAVKVLEDAAEFNAGRGSVLTEDGTVETDAAVADGRRRRAGAVAAGRGVRNPVEAARAVMERTEHVLVAGDAVARLAERWGLELEPEEWFVTDNAREQLRRALAPGETVGAVARDRDGHLAAAASTGGRVAQLRGRVGDSPVIGAGIWADDRTCAVSATGQGEAFVMAAFAHEVDARMRLSGAGIAAACDGALQAVSARGGKGGCIAVDAAGNLAMPFTTAGMFRGFTDASGEMVTAAVRE